MMSLTGGGGACPPKVMSAQFTKDGPVANVIASSMAQQGELGARTCKWHRNLCLIVSGDCTHSTSRARSTSLLTLYSIHKLRFSSFLPFSGGPKPPNFTPDCPCDLSRIGCYLCADVHSWMEAREI